MTQTGGDLSHVDAFQRGMSSGVDAVQRGAFPFLPSSQNGEQDLPWNVSMPSYLRLSTAERLKLGSSSPPNLIKSWIPAFAGM